VETVSSSPEETEAVAAQLAARLAPGDVVAVSGELGSGKTTFVRGRYRGAGLDVSHLDLFRFQAVSPAEWGDLEPYFDDAVTFVEWPEAGAGVLPPARAVVRLRHAEGGRRLISIDGADTRV
jgi:tRNA threonylcarbamoyladenosine biosynthesis protein TsaE